MNYMSTNDLVANSDKTELLVCRPKKGKNNPTPLHINIGGYDVEESTSVKLLGMHISNDLSSAEHVRQLEKHLHHILFTLRWMKSKISKTHLIRVAEGIFISRIMYGIATSAKGQNSSGNISLKEEGKMIDDDAEAVKVLNHLFIAKIKKTKRKSQ